MAVPYQIRVSDAALDGLLQRLSLSSLPDGLDDAAWDMGTPLSDMRRLLDHWKTSFSWRKSEQMLNEMPNYRTTITVEGFGDLGIHFVHRRSEVTGAIPLLFCHGWPGSFLEVEKLLPLLCDPQQPGDVAFHVVCPSLPNFGFSDGVRKRDFGLGQYATASHELMLQLGYQEYVTQGGDWGFHITRTMGLLFPSSVKASHINVTECFPPTLREHPVLWLQDKLVPYTEHERAGLERTAEHQKEGVGYDILQQTKPQTISYALADSPVALLAWIYEKLHGWTDDYPWTDDEVLTWVCIYWFSVAGPAASTRIYFESTHMHNVADKVMYERPMRYIPRVKYGIASFPRDLSVHPNTWVATLGNVVLHSRRPHGGHFAAVEHPEAILEDLQNMLRRGGKCYGSVEGCDGYSKTPHGGSRDDPM